MFQTPGESRHRHKHTAQPDLSVLIRAGQTELIRREASLTHINTQTHMHATPAHTKPIKGQKKNRSDSFTPLIRGPSTHTCTHTRTHTLLLIGSCPSVGKAFIPGYMDDGANTWGLLFICPAQVAELTCCLPACLSASLYLPPSVCFCLSLTL